MKFEFEFKPIRMDYKTQELYSKILVDVISPYYFATIKESKYYDKLDDLSDKYKASIEFQKLAYTRQDYKPKCSEIVNGITRSFTSQKTATKWLKEQVIKNFDLKLK